MDLSNNVIYNINMSPLLSKRFEDYENHLNSLHKKMDDIMVLLKDNNKKQDEYINILRENRKIYLDAFEKIQQTEDKEIKPMISKLTNTLYMPTFEQRLLNRVWRTKHTPNDIHGLLTIPEIHTSSGFLNLDTKLKPK